MDGNSFDQNGAENKSESPKEVSTFEPQTQFTHPGKGLLEAGKEPIAGRRENLVIHLGAMQPGNNNWGWS